MSEPTKRAIRCALILPVIAILALMFWEMFPYLFIAIFLIIGLIIAYPFFLKIRLSKTKTYISNGYNLIIDGIITPISSIDANGFTISNYRVTRTNHKKKTIYLKTVH